MVDVSELGARKLVSDPTHESMKFECLIWGASSSKRSAHELSSAQTDWDGT